MARTHFLTSAFADEYAETIAKQCAGLKTFGIRCIELRNIDGKSVADLTEEEAHRVKDCLDKNGISVSAIGSPIGKVRIDEDLSGHFMRAEHVLRLAKIFETQLVRIFSFYPASNMSAQTFETKVFDALSVLVEKSDRYGITLCHENEAGIYGESPQKCLQIAQRFAGTMRLVFDMGNFVLDGYDPLEAYALLKNHIAYFHIKDALAAGAIVPAGKGEAKIEDILRAARTDMSGDVFVSIEPHLQTFAGLNALVGKTFVNPYKYENQKVAFADAVQKVHDILRKTETER